MAKTKLRDSDNAEEKACRAKRQNSQMKIYLLIAGIIVLAWLIGTSGFSFLWVFGLTFIAFVIWYTKVLNIVELYIKEREISLHRKRALRQSESAEWLNFVLNRWWVFNSTSIQEIVKKKLNPMLPDIKPYFIDQIEMVQFDVGTRTPFIKSVRAFDFAEGQKNAATWTNITSPPDDLNSKINYSLALEMDVGIYCPDLRMVFRTRLASLGVLTDTAVTNLSLSGKLQATLFLSMDTGFPHIYQASISFLEQPEVSFELNVSKAFHLMEVPMLKSWLYTMVQDTLARALVDPRDIKFTFEPTGPSAVPDKYQSQARAEGVLLVFLSGINERLRDHVEETRYCQLTMTNQKKHTEHRTVYGPWDDVCAFLVTDFKNDTLKIKCKSKVLLSLQTLTTFDVKLSLNLMTGGIVSNSVPLAQAVKRGRITTSVSLDCRLEYTPLLSLGTIIQSNGQVENLTHPEVKAAVGQVAGVVFINVHSATGLLGLDPNGFSDPYCTVYCNGKKVLTTHYIATTKNPTWEVSAETMVMDYSKAMFTFLVYDWDGVATSQDDFLGAAHYTLEQDKPVAIRHRLILGHNVLNQDAPDSTLGSLYVTVIFRPVDSVATAEDADEKKEIAAEARDADRQLKLRQSLLVPTDEKLPTAPAWETKGLSLVQLTIYQAKDLKAADRGGTSDPYCKVMVNGKKKHTTAAISKTLTPVWDEKFRLELPEGDNTVQIVVYDRDMLGRDDPLGKVVFDNTSLMRHSKDGQSWFQLEDCETGWIQIFITNLHKESKSATSKSADAGQYSPPPTIPENTVMNPVNGVEIVQKHKKSRFPSFNLRKRKVFADNVSVGSRDSDFSRVGSMSSATSLPASEKYVGVQAKILRIRGVTEHSPSMYCKVRLDDRNKEKRSRKFSQGHVIAKSSLINPSMTSNFGYAFEVDYGAGVAKEALVVFDLKSSSRDHVATKGYILQDLFQDQEEITQWVTLENGIDIELYLSQNNPVDHVKGKFGGIMQRFKRNNQKQQ